MRLLPTSLLLGATVLSGCGGSSSGTGAKPTQTPGPQAAARSVSVQAREFGFAPGTIRAGRGKVHFTLRNQGKTVHELIVLKTKTAPGALAVDGKGRVSEKTSAGEVSETSPGKSRTATIDLEPGRYVIVCNIPGHYKSGMYGTLLVT